jgi:hypothetical protein
MQSWRQDMQSETGQDMQSWRQDMQSERSAEIIEKAVVCNDFSLQASRAKGKPKWKEP